MNNYKIYIKYKKGVGEDLSISIDTEESVKKALVDNWNDITVDGAWTVGDYTILMNDILWIRIEGDKLVEKPSRNKL